MTNKVPKVKLTYYDVGEGNHFVSYPTFKGYQAYGSIEGDSVQMEGKDIKEIESKLVDYLAEAKTDYTTKASICHELALTLMEKGLGKLVKDLGDKK